MGPSTVNDTVQTRTPRRLSLTKNIGFSIIGRGYYAVTQFLVIMLAARLGTLEDVGTLTLCAAIVTPLFFLATMGTRDVLTVDDLDRFSRADYTLLRLVGSILAVVISIATAFFFYGSDTAPIVASVIAFSLVKFTAAQASMNHAMFQRAERSDLVAISIFVRGTVGLLAFGIMFWQTGNLPLALFCEAAAWFISYWFFEQRMLMLLKLNTPFASLSQSSMRNVGALAVWVLPVGLGLWLMRAAISVPPMVLEHIGGLAAVGLFGALAYVHTALSMIVNAMGSASAARLRRYAREKRAQDFWVLARRLTGVSLVLGGAATLFAWALGGPLLQLVFGTDYAQPQLFTIIVAASSVAQLASPLTTAVNAMQAFRWRVFISGSCLIAAIIASVFLIPAYGVFGAAWSFMASSAAYLVATLMTCWVLMRDEGKASHG